MHYENFYSKSFTTSSYCKSHNEQPPYDIFLAERIKKKFFLNTTFIRILMVYDIQNRKRERKTEVHPLISFFYQ